MTTNRMAQEHSYFNPYYIKDAVVTDIVFFDPDTQEVIGNTDSGWVYPVDRGSNNDGNDVLESIDYVRTTNAGIPKAMRAGKSFYVCLKGKKRRVYVSSADLPKFRNLGEQLAMTTDERRYYGTFISFEFAMPKLHARLLENAPNRLEGVDDIAGTQERKVMLGRYTRSEFTDYGIAVDAVEEVIDPRKKLTKYDRSEVAKQLLDDADNVIVVLKQHQANVNNAA